jgi:transposase-like protein
METNAGETIKCLHRLLCRKYLVAHFETLSIHVQPGGPERDYALQWALGVLADGRSDVLGVWLNRRSGGECWEAVFDDLKIRGAESIRFVASREQAGLHSAVNAAYPEATVLPFKGQLLHQTPAPLGTCDGEFAANRRGLLDVGGGGGESARSGLDGFADRKHGSKYSACVQPWQTPVLHRVLLDETPRRFKRVVQWGEAAVQQLHKSLRHAVARRGSFADQEAAVSFAVGTLERAESRLGALDADLDIAHHRAESARARSMWKTRASGISPILA